MARTYWKDRIGEQKTVEGYVFTIVGIDGQKLIVDVMGKKFKDVSRDVWKKGVFKKQLKELRPKPSKYFGQRQKIEGVWFEIKNVIGKNRVEVGADGYEGVKPMCIQTWKNAKFFKNIMKVLKRIVEKITGKLSTYVYTHGYLRDALMNMKHYEYSEEYKLEKNKVDYYGTVNKAMDLTIKNYLDTTEDDEEIMKQIIDGLEKERERQLNDIEAQWAYYYRMTKFSKYNTLQDVKKLYRELCNKEHPDKGGDVMKFRAIKQAYEETKKYIEEHMAKAKVNMADLFAEFGF